MSESKRDLKGAVVAITGASSGIGAATARLLIDAEANVVAAARREDRLRELADARGGERVLAMPMDVRSPEDNRRIMDEAVRRFGRLDCVVLNAGIGRYGGILDGSDTELSTMMETNFAGCVWGVRAAVPHLIDAGGGDIVIVASVAGLRAGGNEAVYAATKFAQMGLAGAIDRELRPQGIRVTAICPASVKTEFAIGAGRAEGDPWLDEVLRAEDVARAIVTVLTQPRHVRTSIWTMWGMAEAS